MYRKEFKRKFLSFILIGMLFVSMFGQVNVQANTSDNKYTYEEEGYNVTLEIKSQWDDEWNGLITIENTANQPIQNWYLKFKSNNEILDMWNGEIVEHTEDTYVIKNSAWNHDIKSGEKLNIGFTASYNNNEIDIPIDFSIPTEKTIVGVDNYEISYVTKDQWGMGFTGEIELKNISNKVIEDWSLQFHTEDVDSLSFDNAVIVSSEDDLYEIHNTFADMDLLPEQTVKLAVTGKKDTNQINPILNQFELSQIGYEYHHNIEPEESIDIGEIYFKQIESDEDVLFNEDNGLYYVKNQLLISGVLANNYKTFEILADEIDARIVGYIELTNDYQIEFNRQMQYDELENMIDYLSGFSYIEYVSLNIALIDEEKITTTNDAEYKDSVWDEENPGGKNWGAEAIKAPSAWDYNNDMQTVKVGVIDSRFYDIHEDLEFEDAWNNPVDGTGTDHGNHVAGIMAAEFNNNKGIAGISPKNQLYGYALYGEEGQFRRIFSSIQEFKIAYTLLIGNNVKVINVSMGKSDEIVFAASKGNPKAINLLKKEAEILKGHFNKLLIKGYDFLIISAAGNEENSEIVINGNSKYGYEVFDEEEHPLDTPKISGNVLAVNGNALNYIDDPLLKSRIITVGSFGHEISGGGYYYAASSNTGDRVDIAAPGVDIHSVSYAYMHNGEKVSKYTEKSGTSMAAPHVSGVAAMIYGIDPSLSAEQVKDIIIDSNSRKITDAHGNSYPMLNALSSVEKAIEIRDNPPLVTIPKGDLKGKVVDEDNNVVKNALVTAYRTSIDESNNLEYYSSNIETDENGSFNLSLIEGKYNVIISKYGYLPVVIKDVSIEAGGVEYLEDAILADQKIGFLDSIGVLGNVSNALTGEEISNATIKFRPGWNSMQGNYVKGLFGDDKSVTTDNIGKFDISLPTGHYTAEISKDGFVTGYYNVFSSKSFFEHNLVLTPILSDNEYRIILTWGSTPRDLDSYLLGTLESGQQFQVYYGNKSYTYYGNTVAKLDRDDTNSYGPETITLSIDGDLFKNGTYEYIVHDYTNRNNPSSTEMSQSGASVRVYHGNNLIRTFNVPINEPGNLWPVFKIENGVVKAL